MQRSRCLFRRARMNALKPRGMSVCFADSGSGSGSFASVARRLTRSRRGRRGCGVGGCFAVL